ncbi:MAG: TIGR03936 family radical SAM-associated protein [Peptococcaceae bacterium]|jgi:radical SAM-linked protein|nr:TIGR03936 family radical SAM-associated protein [Peptococcaceae bacterium]MDH7525535.1 TIGR03936 family radical SAM-associated protein [Peptococcaceae bacterium]
MLLRIKYAKTAAGRFLSHLDLLRTMERAFRRACLPLAFSEGYNPHPRVSYASALAVGVTSDGEYLDVELREEVPLSLIRQKLDCAMPPGIKILGVKRLVSKGKSLAAQINMARYVVETKLLLPLGKKELELAVARAVSQPFFNVVREGKKGKRQVNIKEGIYSLKAEPRGEILVIEMDIRTGSERNVRPEEVVEMLARVGNIPLGDRLSIHRIGLFIKDDEGIKTPVD